MKGLGKAGAPSRAGRSTRWGLFAGMGGGGGLLLFPGPGGQALLGVHLQRFTPS